MSTATLEEITANPSGIFSRVAAGEMFCVMQSGHIIARILPEVAPPQKEITEWPDFAARQRAIFGDAEIPADVVREIHELDREQGFYEEMKAIYGGRMVYNEEEVLANREHEAGEW